MTENGVPVLLWWPVFDHPPIQLFLYFHDVKMSYFAARYVQKLIFVTSDHVHSPKIPVEPLNGEVLSQHIPNVEIDLTHAWDSDDALKDFSV